MEQDRILMAMNQASNMRLVAEGAIRIYENEAMPLYTNALKNGNLEEMLAFDTIGTALNTLRNQIEELQKKLMQEQADL